MSRLMWVEYFSTYTIRDRPSSPLPAWQIGYCYNRFCSRKGRYVARRQKRMMNDSQHINGSSHPDIGQPHHAAADATAASCAAIAATLAACRGGPAEQARLPKLLDALPGYVTIIDAQHRIRFANQSFRKLYSVADQAPCFRVRYGLEHPCQDCPLERILTTFEAEEWDESLGDGQCFHVWAVPFTDVDGAPTVLMYGIDVTRQRDSELLLSETSEGERRRISAHLHDALGQTLAGVGYLVQGLADKHVGIFNDQRATIDSILQAVNDAVKQVRTMARGLDPVGVDDHGLHAAMDRLVRNMQNSDGLDCRLQWSCSSHVRPAAATHLYLIAQEALQNVVRHAQARRAAINLRESYNSLVLQISDDGCGIPAGRHGAGMGIRMMHHRATALGGRLLLSAGEVAGTTVTCSVPKAKVLAIQGETNDRQSADCAEA